MLLNVVRGAQKFADIRTIDCVVYPTFQEVCNALGLLDNEKEWEEALEEATFWATPSVLRGLFSTIIIFCEVANPVSLWEKFWLAMSEDVRHA